MGSDGTLLQSCEQFILDDVGIEGGGQLGHVVMDYYRL